MATLPEQSLGFLVTTVDPSVSVMPPVVNPRTTFPKKFTVNGTFHVNDAALDPTGDKITTQKGIIAWFPGRGIDHSMTRLGVVPSGHDVKSKISSNGWSGFVGNFGEDATLRCNEELPLPYETSENIRVNPDPAADFSQVRLISGALRIESTTRPIGSVALNGWLSAGVSYDDRDISRKNGIAYPVSALMQQSLLDKDARQEVSVNDGIVLTVGPDIPLGFKAPNADLSILRNGGYQTLSPSGTYDLAMPSWAIGDTYAHSSHWISPYNTTMVTSFSPAYQYNFDAVNMHVHPAIEFRMGCRQLQTATAGVTATFVFTARFIHVYGYIDHLGSVQWIQVGTDYEKTLATANSGLGSTQGDLIISDEAGSALPYTFGDLITDAQKRAIYVGTRVEIKVQLAACTIAGTPGALPADAHMVFNAPIISFIAYNIYNEGELGPVRIVRWDEVGDGQTMNIKGVLLAQCVPEGKIAPYVSVDALLSNTANQVNVMGLVQALYNSPWKAFRRIYTGIEYDTAVQELRNLRVADFMARLRGDAAVVRTSAEASGLFGEILYNVLAPATGDEDLAHQIAGSVGGIPDTLARAALQGAQGVMDPQSHGGYGDYQAEKRGRIESAGMYGRARSSMRRIR